MIRIAVVGEIGSGKTYVAKLLGFPVFNADKEVSKIYSNNYDAYKNLKIKLPKFIFSFPIQKREIGNAVKNNLKNLKIISKIVHPIVRKNMYKFLKNNNLDFKRTYSRLNEILSKKYIIDNSPKQHKFLHLDD